MNPQQALEFIGNLFDEVNMPRKVHRQLDVALAVLARVITPPPAESRDVPAAAGGEQPGETAQESTDVKDE